MTAKNIEDRRFNCEYKKARLQFSLSAVHALRNMGRNKWEVTNKNGDTTQVSDCRMGRIGDDASFYYFTYFVESPITGQVQKLNMKSDDLSELEIQKTATRSPYPPDYAFDPYSGKRLQK